MIRDLELFSSAVSVSGDSALAQDETGASVWDAGLVLAHYLSRLAEQTQGAFLRGKRVLDVGCGTGVVGLSAAALGAAAVVLTDLPHLLPTAERNIQVNRLEHTATVAALRWGEPAAHLQPPFDLVLASDVFYQAGALPSLLATLREVSGPGTRILVANEHRERLPFPTEQLHVAGFTVQQVPQQELHPDWTSEDIGVYRLALQGS